MFKNPFSFDGRIRRTEYGISFIIYFIAYVAIILIIEDIDKSGLLMLLSVIPVVWFILAQGAKRCHDLGKTGWFQIIPFYIFWLIFQDGQKGVNEYGLNPKGVGNESFTDEIIGKIGEELQ